jgi:flavin-dependent amine oxidoreductase
METIERDVAVIGAGVTGLTAADRLSAAGKSVIVLEARDRNGGRLWTDVIDGQLREIGDQWVSPDQTALIDMLRDLGLETYPRYRDGDSVCSAFMIWIFIETIVTGSVAGTALWVGLGALAVGLVPLVWYWVKRVPYYRTRPLEAFTDTDPLPTPRSETVPARGDATDTPAPRAGALDGAGPV